MTEKPTAAERLDAARGLYESTDGMTLERVAETLGFEPRHLAAVAESEAWKPAGPLPAVDPRQRLAALSKSFEQQLGQPPSIAGDEFPELAPPPPAPETATELVADPESSRKAELIERHRSEWLAVRGQIYAAARSKDSEAMRRARTMAEAIRLVQDGERQANGIGQKESANPLLIDRT